jgi:hypothetical protein
MSLIMYLILLGVKITEIFSNKLLDKIISLQVIITVTSPNITIKLTKDYK